MWLSYDEIGYVVASIEEIRYLTKDSTDFSMAIRNFTMFTMFTKQVYMNVYALSECSEYIYKVVVQMTNFQ